MDIDEAAIDEGLYSRQLYVLGHEAMKKMAASNVLIVGMKGLGVEIDIGKPRAAATLPRLAELNTYVPVRDLGGKPGDEITVELIKGFHVVVLCNVSYQKQLEINDWTHENGVHFIAAETRGLFGSAFNDFGPKFTCVDPTGEQPLTGMIVSIDKAS
ncbi:hypothetical protein CVT26_008546 [Gymnopilus dilepis]|uniref:Uncharacterized protein n=1 Tax=Gymnopilus dilepis TaxID=231916 RepID=A0A409XXN0_9AGAR|nr:hypothetical protein CVT26_008546 [Gymnopilus dilepis]